MKRQLQFIACTAALLAACGGPDAEGTSEQRETTEIGSFERTPLESLENISETGEAAADSLVPDSRAAEGPTDAEEGPLKA